MLWSRHGFTIVELMVVVAIIGILSAIAIPQYNKFKGNSHLANVQNMAKHIAKSAIILGSSAQKNPPCSNASEITISMNGVNLVAKYGDIICDTMSVWNHIPNWVSEANIQGTLIVTSDGRAIGDGTIKIISTYKYKNRTLGCIYDPRNDTLIDAENSKCSLVF